MSVTLTAPEVERLVKPFRQHNIATLFTTLCCDRIYASKRKPKGCRTCPKELKVVERSTAPDPETGISPEWTFE